MTQVNSNEKVPVKPLTDKPIEENVDCQQAPAAIDKAGSREEQRVRPEELAQALRTIEIRRRQIYPGSSGQSFVQ